jgi:hypothetical protein
MKRALTLCKRAYHVISILILIFFYQQSKAQIVDSESTVKSIKENLFEFLIREEGLERKTKLEDYESRTYITELLDQTILGYNKTGIYVFGIFTSHTKKYLLLKNGATHKILDPEKLGTTLQELSNFLVEQKMPDAKMVEYVEAVTRIYRINENRNPAKLEGKTNK